MRGMEPQERETEEGAQVSVATILEVPDIRFVEPTFADLIDPAYNDTLASVTGRYGRLLVDENEEPLAMAFGEGSHWKGCAFHLRPLIPELIEKFEESDGEIYQDMRETWGAAVRAYYSQQIMFSVNPAMEDMNSDRVGMVEDLISGFWGNRRGIRCLDCCCGSGIGSYTLKKRGIAPLSYDNDPALLSLGLMKGRLAPSETMWIDGTRVSRYTGNVEAGLGLMLGEIHQFNREMWEHIVWELVSLTEYSLITVGTFQEAGYVKEWAEERGRSVEVLENQRDPIYDRWICSVEK